MTAATPDSGPDGDVDTVDLAVLNAIRAFYDETDPVPDGLVDRIEFELTLDALHTEVAELMMLQSTAGVRSASTESVRTVTFTSQSLTTMITITPEREGRVRVDGWLAPPQSIAVEVLLASGSVATTSDEDGRFVLEDVPAGLAKFALTIVTGGDEQTVLSPTIEL